MLSPEIWKIIDYGAVPAFLCLLPAASPNTLSLNVRFNAFSCYAPCLDGNSNFQFNTNNRNCYICCNNLC